MEVSGYNGKAMVGSDPFFSLDDFEHKGLWKKGEAVWSALSHLTEYLKAHQGAIEIEIPTGVYLIHPEKISIGEGTIIEPGVMIHGPCIIGKRSVIRHGAYIRENVILGEGCHIGHCAELKHSILLNGAAATHFVYVGDSILGHSVNLGAGVKCANLRLDRKEVAIWVEGKKIETGLKKLGAIVGDLVQIGCNCVLNPGTLIGKESFSYPLIHLQGIIPPRSQIDSKGIHPIQKNILEKLLCQLHATARK